MKKKYAMIAGGLCLTVLVCAAFLFGSGRTRTLDEICKLDPKEALTGAALYRYFPPDEKIESVDLTKEQLDTLLDQMETITYRRIGSAAGMDQDENYATLNYMVGQEKMEIMFSSKNGGRILVHIVREHQKAPLYQMIPSGEAVQKMILNFFDAARQSDG